MKIDVVVPARNAGQYIEHCIGGLLDAGFARHDIIVVDDGSMDDTRAKCEAMGLTPISLEDNASASVARNAGAKAGNGHIVFFVDADVVVHRNTRTFLRDFFRTHPGFAAVFGAYDDSPAASGRVSRIRNLLHRHVHLENSGMAITFWSGCGAIRRRAFEAVGGFDPDLSMMEDVDLGLRLTNKGERILLNPELQGKHLKHWSLASVFWTDLFDRAIPWARILARPDASALPETLNISTTSRISVVSVLASLTGLLVIPFAGQPGVLLVVVAITSLVLANRRFLATLWKGDNPLDTVASIPVLWVHYLCGGSGFAWVRASEMARPLGRRRRAAETG